MRLLRPYWSTPAHNPAFLLLSIAIPFWWSDTFGYRLSAEDRSGHKVEVDTTRQGYRMMGTLALLFNLSPNRGFLPSRTREADHVKLQLVPLLSQARSIPCRPTTGVIEAALARRTMVSTVWP